MNDTIPTALRICLRCHEMAAGEICESCAAIDTQAEMWAQSLFNLRVEHPVWPSSLRIIDQLLRVATEDKLRRLYANAGPLPEMYHECPGCYVEVSQPGYCPDCLAGPPGSWKRTQLAAGRNYAQGADSPARSLRTTAYTCFSIAAMAWILFEFRGFFVELFQLWFGGK